MLREIILYLDKPYLDYDSNIFLSSLPEETIWFRHKWVRVSRYLEEESHKGHSKGSYMVSDTREYTGSIILRIAELKKFGYKIIYRKFY